MHYCPIKRLFYLQQEGGVEGHHPVHVAARPHEAGDGGRDGVGREVEAPGARPRHAAPANTDNNTE